MFDKLTLNDSINKIFQAFKNKDYDQQRVYTEQLAQASLFIIFTIY